MSSWFPCWFLVHFWSICGHWVTYRDRRLQNRHGGVLNSVSSVHILSSHRSAGYSHKRLTENLKVPYYVGEQFSKEFSGVNLKNLERTVEDDYIGNLRNNCWKEKQQSTSFLFPSNSRFGHFRVNLWGQIKISLCEWKKQIVN